MAMIAMIKPGNPCQQQVKNNHIFIALTFGFVLGELDLLSSKFLILEDVRGQQRSSGVVVDVAALH